MINELLSVQGATIALPLIAAIAIATQKSPTLASWLNLAASVASFSLACALPWHLTSGTYLFTDRLAAHMALLTTLTAAAAAWVSRPYIATELARDRLDRPRAIQYYALFQTLLASLMLAQLANNYGLTWVALEAATIAGVLVVGLPRTPEAVEASWKYFLICGVGIGLALFGTITLYLAAQSVLGPGLPAMSWSAVQTAAPHLHAPLLNLAFVFLLIGYGTKAGLAPLHAWMPDAHAEGPTPVSAVLAGAVLNTALATILRLRNIVSANPNAIPPTYALMTIGLASLLLASLSLWRRRDAKRFFSFSTIEQNGLAAFALGLGTPAGTFAGLLHITVHTLAKAALFQTLGRAAQLKASQSFTHLTGLLTSNRTLGLTLAATIIAIAGLPPFGLFTSEILLANATAASDPWLLIPMALGLLIGTWALIWRLITLCFGPPTPNLGPSPHWSDSIPAWLQLTLATILGLAMPAPVTAWFTAIASGAP
jgi:hydrogenase-4 component F